MAKEDKKLASDGEVASTPIGFGPQAKPTERLFAELPIRGIDDILKEHNPLHVAERAKRTPVLDYLKERLQQRCAVRFFDGDGNSYSDVPPKEITIVFVNMTATGAIIVRGDGGFFLTIGTDLDLEMTENGLLAYGTKNEYPYPPTRVLKLSLSFV